MPKRVCLGSSKRPRCGNLATYRGRCSECNKDNERQIPRKGKPIYNSPKWRYTRRKKLSLNPRCEYVDPDEGPCPRMATDVHHRVDLADGGDPWKMENLESLCGPHHSQHTRARQLERGATA